MRTIAQIKEYYDIILLDSGICREHPALANASIDAVALQCANGGDAWELVPAKGDTKGHGTAIAGILTKAIPDASLLMIELFQQGKGYKIEEEELLLVLDYIERHLSGKVINLSLGIVAIMQYKALEDACKRLTEKGFLLVSAFDNVGAISYPAAFPCVIGVTQEKNCTRRNEFVVYPDDIMNLGAMGGLQRVAWIEPPYMMVSGCSFACAHASAQAYRYLKEGARGMEEVLLRFQENSGKASAFVRREYEPPPTCPFTIKKAALFPFNKEMHSLVRFAQDLPFEITGVYDSKYSMTVGSSTAHLMKDADVASIPVENIRNIDWNTFDTLVLGHLDELSGIIRREELASDLLREALGNGKQVYSFDDVSYLFGGKLPAQVFCPAVRAEHVPPYRQGRLAMTGLPVLGVWGTDSKQGKFTLQLQLRKKFKGLGYRVGQIGTEPSALLYGMDYVYPMGHNSSVYTNEQDSVLFLNDLIRRLSIEENELIIVGSQSATVPYGYGNLLMYQQCQYTFLLGTLPDVVVLVINPEDEQELVKRSIHLIEAAADAKVIALVVFPVCSQTGWYALGKKDKLSGARFEQLKQEFERAFSLPVYQLGKERDLDELAQGILAALS